MPLKPKPGKRSLAFGAIGGLDPRTPRFAEYLIGTPLHAARRAAHGLPALTTTPLPAPPVTQDNIAVAFEPGKGGGPAIAQSTFHHFADYNLDTNVGAPSFVDEPPGDAMQRTPQALSDAHRYFRNVALWLAGRQPY